MDTQKHTMVNHVVYVIYIVFHVDNLTRSIIYIGHLDILVVKIL